MARANHMREPETERNMNGESQDCMVEALTLLRKAVRADNRKPGETAIAGLSNDIGELFLADMENRRKRLQHWIVLLSEEVRRHADAPPPRILPHRSRYTCRGRHNAAV